MTETMTCWKCGGDLDGVLLPMARHEECPRCRAQLHVCRMCVWFDPAVAQQCREPVADPVADKQRANFCGYFTANPRAWSGNADPSAAARQSLDALFDGGDVAGNAAEDPQRQSLEDLFRK